MNVNRDYWRVILGKNSANAEDGINGGFIGAGVLFGQDLAGKFPERWQDFNEVMRPVWLEQNPGRSKVAAGLACGMLHTLCKESKIGDVVITPDRDGNYHFGEIEGEYYYDSNYELPHKRPVKWLGVVAQRSDVSDGLRKSVGSGGTVIRLSGHAKEIEAIILNRAAPVLVSLDETVEDPSVFALEKHLEDFLVANWSQTLLGRTHDIYAEEGEMIGQQYPSDTGPIDILAISKNGEELLVVELKKGRASDSVVGQVQRYMGYVQQELAEAHQSVRGAIIALESDKRIENALRVAPNIDFYRYQVRFELIKGALHQR